MARDSRSEARLLTQALDAIETRLAALEREADLDVVSDGLGDAARAFDAAVREVATP